ncbi:hypothetical protein ACFX2I_031048 [Malus domestica]
MENGECSYGVPKLKRRTVSAVRDFPPACGRFGQLRVDEGLLLGEVLTRALKWSCGWADLMNGKDVGTVERIESVATLEHEISDLPNNLHGLKSSRPVEETEFVGTAEFETQMVSTGSVNETALINGEAFGTVERVDLNALLHEISDSLKNPHQQSISISNGNGLEKTAVKKISPSKNTLEARNFGQERSPVDGEPSSSNTAKINVKQTGEDVQDKEFHKSENGGDISIVN